MNLYVDLREGGAICEWDWRPGAVNVADTLARRPEPYHQRLSHAHGHVAVVPPAERLSVHGARERSADAVPAVNGAGTHLGEDLAPLVRGAAPTRASSPALQVATDLVRVKEAGLDRLLHYDWHRRTILLDHVLAPETTFGEYRAARYHDLGDFANQAYTAEVVDTEPAAPLVVRLHRAGHVWEGQRSWPVEVEKVLTLPSDRAALRVDYTVTNTSHRPLHAHFAVESNWGLLGGGNPAASYQVNGAYPEAAALDAIGEESGVRVVRLANTHLNVAVTIAAQDANLWRFRIQTISNSEAGFERVYQCSCTVLWWPLHLEPGQRWTTTLDVTLGPTG